MPDWLIKTIDIVGILAFLASPLVALWYDEKPQIPPGTGWHVTKLSLPEMEIIYPNKSNGWFELGGWPAYVPNEPSWLDRWLGITVESKIERAQKRAQRKCDRLNRRAVSVPTRNEG